MKRHLGGLVGLLIFALLPVAIRDAYFLNVIILFGIFSIFALSLNIIVGYLGEISFGQAAYFGLGAYVSAMLVKDLGVPFVIAIIAAVAFTGLMGIFIGYLTLKLTGAYFAIVTLGFAEIIKLIINNWIWLTHGPQGIDRIPWPSISIPGIFVLEIKGETLYYYFVGLLLIFTILLISRLLNSPTGRAFVAVREHKDLANSVGIMAFKYKAIAFTLSTMLAGMAGAIYAHYFRIITPDVLGGYYSATALLMVFIGSRGTIAGPVIGAFIFTIFPEVLRVAGNARMSIFGILLLITLIFMPQGIFIAGRHIADTISRKINIVRIRAMQE